MVSSKAARTFVWVTSLLKTGIALAIIIIIAVHLHTASFFWGAILGARCNQTVTMSNSAGQSVEVEWTCLLGWDTYRAASLCIYGYVIAGVSIILSASMSVVMVAWRGNFGPNLMCQLAMSVFGMAWWLIAMAVLSNHSQRADSMDVPNNNWRHSIWIMSYVMTHIYMVMFYVDVHAGRAARDREAAANAVNKGSEQTVGVVVAAPIVVMMPNKAEDGTVLIAYAA